MSRWQHVIPQEPTHEVVPKRAFSMNTCKVCKKRVVQVADSEGPESLKSLLRLG